jgi:hypothetical protein
MIDFIINFYFRDWGNYCEYIERPGDIQEYRSCVFTCTMHGCNPANTLHKSSSLWLMASAMTAISLVLNGFSR